MATGIELYIQNCQDRADQGIGTMESAILSSFAAVYDGPPLDDIKAILDGIDLTVPENIPALGNFTLSPVPSVQFAPHTTALWAGNYMANIQALLATTLTTGGVGISQQLQDAIFNADRERKMQVLTDALRKVDAGVGAKGFRMRNDYLAGQRQEVILKYQFDMEQLNRDVTKLMEEHARTNWQFCVENGISAEKFQADFTGAYDKLVTDMASASVEIYRSQVDLQLAIFKAQAEAVLMQWETVKARLTAGSTAMMAKASELELWIKDAAERARTQIGSHTSEATRLSNAYTSYSNMVMAYAKSASGGAFEIKRT